jgi:uncharacterized protein
MPFNDRSRLDPSQVEDRRGRGAGTTMAIGDGLGLVILVAALLLGVDPSDLGGLVEQPPASVSTESPGSTSSLEEQCRTGADANTREDCRIVGFVNSIQSFWTDEFARQGASYAPAKLVLFSGATVPFSTTMNTYSSVLQEVNHTAILSLGLPKQPGQWDRASTVL